MGYKKLERRNYGLAYYNEIVLQYDRSKYHSTRVECSAETEKILSLCMLLLNKFQNTLI